MRVKSTDGRLQAGVRDLTGGLFNKKDLQNLDKKGELETEEPSVNPL